MAPLSCVVYTTTRDVAESLVSQPANRELLIFNAIVDDTTFSPENLALVVRAAWPRPQAFVIGSQVSDDNAELASQVWDKYAEEVGLKNRGLVRVPYGLLLTKGPDAILTYTVDKLEDVWKAYNES